MNDPELIFNPVSNRYVKRTSQCGKRLAKVLQTPPMPIPTHINQPAPQPQASPVQKSISSACADLVASQPKKFRDLSSQEMDALFKRLLLQKLGVAEPSKKKEKKVETKQKKKAPKKFKILSSSSESDSDSDSD